MIPFSKGGVVATNLYLLVEGRFLDSLWGTSRVGLVIGPTGASLL